MNEEHIIFTVLMDFLKELPKDFHKDKTTYSRATEIVMDFMQMHGLSDEKEE